MILLLLFAQLLFQDWSAELEKPGRIEVSGNRIVIDVPAGLTLWYKPALEAPVVIEYEAKMIQAGGANDRVSDLNCFWMASDSRSPADLFATRRSGKFSDYDQLVTYYVGLGGNSNTTTRFRRYIGKQDLRPLLPEHDLKAPLLTPNKRIKIRLVAKGNHIEYFLDGKRIFDFVDPSPLTKGRFAFRTVSSHFEVYNFKIYRP